MQICPIVQNRKINKPILLHQFQNRFIHFDFGFFFLQKGEKIRRKNQLYNYYIIKEKSL